MHMNGISNTIEHKIQNAGPIQGIIRQIRVKTVTAIRIQTELIQ